MKKWIAGACLGILIAALVIFYTTSSSQSLSMSKRYIVNLYSGNTVAATWTARDFGRLDGETLILTVGSDFDSQLRRIRINGIYSIEEIE